MRGEKNNLNGYNVTILKLKLIHLHNQYNDNLYTKRKETWSGQRMVLTVFLAARRRTDEPSKTVLLLLLARVIALKSLLSLMFLKFTKERFWIAEIEVHINAILLLSSCSLLSDSPGFNLFSQKTPAGLTRTTQSIGFFGFGLINEATDTFKCFDPSPTGFRFKWEGDFLGVLIKNKNSICIHQIIYIYNNIIDVIFFEWLGINHNRRIIIKQK